MPVAKRIPADLEPWLAQYSTTTATLNAGAVAATTQAYRDVRDWESATQTLAAASAASATATAARQAHASAAAEFMATVVEMFTGRRPQGRTLREIPYGRNAKPFDVYSRPVFVYRDALDQDRSETEAQVAAFGRAEQIAMTDALLARRDAAYAQIVDTPEATGYRRVIRPELSATGTCGLCIAAALQIYSFEELMPIHTRCKCEVLPIIGGLDPARTFNQADLERLYADTTGTSRSELTRYRIKPDPELGPVLEPLPVAA